jgi:hypothetical protein
MSLLDDLQAIDLSAIVNARGSIRIAVDDGELRALLEGGAAQAALAGLGQSIANLGSTFSSPEAILRPIADSIGGISGSISIDGLPIQRYVSAVSEGVTVILRLIEGLESDPNNIGAFLGASLGDQIESVTRLITSYANVGTPELGRMRATLDRVDRGFTGSPVEIGNLALEVLLPFPRSALADMRSGIDGILQGAGSIQLPQGRFAGLEAALDAVNAAALAADAAALQRALQQLAQVRANTVAVIQGDLLGVFDQIGRIRLDLVLDPVARAAGALRVAQTGVLDLLESIRTQLAHVRAQVEGIDPAQIGAFFDRFVQFLEEQARLHIVAPIEAQVARLDEFIRSLFRHLPLGSLRAEISRFLAQVADAIDNLGVADAVASVRATLASVQETISAGNLTNEVQAAVGRARDTITRVLDNILAPLEAISTRVNQIAGDVEGVLQRAADALAGFSSAIQNLSATIDQLGIDAAADQVVETLRTLRETAEQLLSAAPIPEPMRPVVEQLISTLEGIDFDVIFQPVRDAVAQIQVPDEIRANVTAALTAVRDAIENLIPSELIASIEAEVHDALEVIRSFDPSTLLTGVTDFLDEAADMIERLDPRQAVGVLREPFQAVLGAIDAAHPRRLLAPVIEAYDSAFARLQLPAPDLAMRRFSDLVSAAGEAAAQAATAPVRQLASPAATAGTAPTPQPGAGTPSSAAPPAGAGTPIPPTFRPGDAVRLFGYIPARLREALQALDSGPAGEVLRHIDALTAGLARDLRRVQAELADVERRVLASLDAAMIPIAQRQLTAQANIRARFSAGTIQVDAAVASVALVGPGALRHELAQTIDVVRDRVQGAVRSAGGNVGAALERAATALEGARLSKLTGGLDSLLAALDPEPLARDLDDLAAAALRRAPEILTAVEAELVSASQRLVALIEDLNPGVQAQKFVRVLQTLKEQLDVLNPSLLADELGEIHAAIRRTIAAFDPAPIADDLFAIVQEAAQSIRALDPAALLGDLSFLDDIVDRVEAAVPTAALQGVGESLTVVGERLVELDPGALLDSIEAFGPRIIDEFGQALDAIRDEVVALLEAIKYANANASASVSVSVGG